MRSARARREPPVRGKTQELRVQHQRPARLSGSAPCNAPAGVRAEDADYPGNAANRASPSRNARFGRFDRFRTARLAVRIPSYRLKIPPTAERTLLNLPYSNQLHELVIFPELDLLRCK